jgi:hypothetical protein
MIEHRQGFFLQIQAVIGYLQLSIQSAVFFFKLIDAPSLWCTGSYWAGGAFAQSGHAIFRILSSPFRELAAVELFTA